MLPGNVQPVKRENLRGLARSMGGGRDVLNGKDNFLLPASSALV